MKLVSIIVLATSLTTAVFAQDIVGPKTDYVTMKCEELGFTKLNKFSVEIVVNEDTEEVELSAKVYAENLAGDIVHLKTVLIQKQNNRLVKQAFASETGIPTTTYKGEGFSLKIQNEHFYDAGYASELLFDINGRDTKRTMYCETLYYAL